MTFLRISVRICTRYFCMQLTVCLLLLLSVFYFFLLPPCRRLPVSFSTFIDYRERGDTLHNTDQFVRHLLVCEMSVVERDSEDAKYWVTINDAPQLQIESFKHDHYATRSTP